MCNFKTDRDLFVFKCQQKVCPTMADFWENTKNEKRAEGAKHKPFHCEEKHNSAFLGCEAHQREADVQYIINEHEITHVQAKKSVDQHKLKFVSKHSSGCSGYNKIQEDTVLVVSGDLVLIAVDVISFLRDG